MNLEIPDLNEIEDIESAISIVFEIDQEISCLNIEEDFACDNDKKKIIPQKVMLLCYRERVIEKFGDKGF